MTPGEPKPDGAARKRSRMPAHDRRESILDAATELFAESGYRQTKLSTVAKRLGVSEPVIFQNFATKAVLFAEVVNRATRQACDMVEHARGMGVPVSRLLALALNPEHLRQVHAPGNLGAIFAHASAVTGQPEVETAARDSTRRFANLVTELLEQGRADGELRSDLDVEAAAWWLLSLVSSQAFRRATAPDPVDIENRLAQATLAYLTGDFGA